MILSSHILSEVSAVCDEVMIISHGKLVASDTPENLSRLAVGADNLQLVVKGRKIQIEEALKSIDEVEKLYICENRENNMWDVTVTASEGNDVREKVFYKLAEERCPIMEMKSNRASLEDVFLELTENEKEDIRQKETVNETENVDITEKPEEKGDESSGSNL